MEGLAPPIDSDGGSETSLTYQTFEFSTYRPCEPQNDFLLMKVDVCREAYETEPRTYAMEVDRNIALQFLPVDSPPILEKNLPSHLVSEDLDPVDAYIGTVGDEDLNCSERNIASQFLPIESSILEKDSPYNPVPDDLGHVYDDAVVDMNYSERNIALQFFPVESPVLEKDPSGRSISENPDHNSDRDAYNGAVGESDLNYSDMNDTTKEDLENTNFSVKLPALPNVTPVLTSCFMTMENSNNAIDNNICPGDVPSAMTDENSSGHIFKLPDMELTFNGTLKHLKCIDPKNVDCFKSIFSKNGDESIIRNDESAKTEVEVIKSPNAPSDDGKFVISSSSQYPSDSDAFPCDNYSNAPSGSSFVENSLHLSDTNLHTSFSSTLNASIMNENYENDSVFSRINENSFNEPVYSPSLFSDDGDDVSFSNNQHNQENYDVQKFLDNDKKFVKRLEKTLQGVPPPPSITISQLTASEMLKLYQENLPKYDCLNSSTEINTTLKNCDDISTRPINDSNISLNKSEQSNSSRGENNLSVFEKLININTDEKLVTKEDWPQLLSLRYYDIYYNYSSYSEEVDSLLARYLLRYIGCETTSSCMAYPLKNSPVKRSLRSNVGKSPGRRLSHLARRKITFCNADNVKNLTTKKQILIDQRRYAGLFGRNQPLRRSPRKRVTPKKTTPLKKTKTPKKKTPSSGQKKNTSKNVPNVKEQIPRTRSTRESSKRALFLSPDNTESTQMQNSSAVASTSRPIRSRCALFMSPVKGSDKRKFLQKDEIPKNEDTQVSVISRKRKSETMLDSEFNHKSKIQRSLSFGGDNIDTNSQSRIQLCKHASELTVNKSEILNDLQKKKLLWAVAEALRCHSIGVKHEKFRLHLNSLARLTHKISQLPKYARFLRTPGNSTSATLLRIAKKHAFVVLRGKSIDEIFNEEQIRQMDSNPTKLTGYIPKNAHEKEKVTNGNIMKNDENSHGSDSKLKVQSVNSTKTVLQDKTITLNIETNGSVEKTPFTDSRASDGDVKMRACRSLNFDVDTFQR